MKTETWCENNYASQRTLSMMWSWHSTMMWSWHSTMMWSWHSTVYGLLPKDGILCTKLDCMVEWGHVHGTWRWFGSRPRHSATSYLKIKQQLFCISWPCGDLLDCNCFGLLPCSVCSILQPCQGSVRATRATPTSFAHNSVFQAWEWPNLCTTAEITT